MRDQFELVDLKSKTDQGAVSDDGQRISKKVGPVATVVRRPWIPETDKKNRDQVEESKFDENEGKQVVSGSKLIS